MQENFIYWCGYRGRPPRGGRGLKYICDAALVAGVGRPPRGGRGLKYLRMCSLLPVCNVALLAEGVD